MPGKKYVTGFLFSADASHLVLIKKINPAWQRGLFNGIGGKVEANEIAVDAMVRECLEETGVLTYTYVIGDVLLMSIGQTFMM